MSDRIPLSALEHGTSFADRHIGPRPAELARMLDVVGVGSLDELADRAVPSSIRDLGLAAIDLPAPATEWEALAELRALAAANRPMVQMIGLGYHGTVTPPVIRRNVLESPAWYSFSARATRSATWSEAGTASASDARVGSTRAAF